MTSIIKYGTAQISISVPGSTKATSKKYRLKEIGISNSPTNKNSVPNTGICECLLPKPFTRLMWFITKYA